MIAPFKPEPPTPVPESQQQDAERAAARNAFLQMRDAVRFHLINSVNHDDRLSFLCGTLYVAELQP